MKDLKPSGMTAGGTAIKQGFKLNKKTHIPNGNNIVIMITDGAFNKGDKDYLASIEENYQKKGVRFSVVGIKMSQYLTGYMKDITVKGGVNLFRSELLKKLRKSLSKKYVEQLLNQAKKLDNNTNPTINIITSLVLISLPNLQL